MQLLLHRHREASGCSVVVLHEPSALVGNLVEDLRRDALGIDKMHLAADRALDGSIELRGRSLVADAGHITRHAHLEGGGAGGRLVDLTVTADDKGPIVAVFHLDDTNHSNLRPFKG